MRLLSAMFLLGGGCVSHEAKRADAPPATMPAASIDLPVVAFGDLVRRDGVLVFWSWEGKWIGMDCDTDLRFLAGGKVEMVEYGLGVMHYQGTYRLDFDGLLTAEFEGYERWPVMRLGSDERSLVLSRSDGRTGMGRDGHGPGSGSGEETYWPFRPWKKGAGWRLGE